MMFATDSYADMTTYPALGFNPAPGNIHAVELVAQDVADAHAALKTAHDTLTKANTKGGAWQGEAAKAFAEKTQSLPELLTTATDSFEKAKSALQTWASQLPVLQDRAREYEARAEEARKRLEEAKNSPDIEFAIHRLPDDASLPNALRRHEAAVQRLRNAEEDVRAIISDAERLMAEHKKLAENLMSTLGQAGEAAPDKPDVLDKVLDGVQDLVSDLKDLAGEVEKWVQKNAEAIAAVGDALAMASTIVGLAGLALTETGIGVPLSAVATSLSYMALVTHSTAKLAGADVDPMTLVADGLGMASGGLGSSALKTGNATAKTVNLTKKGEKAVTLGLAGDTFADLPEDPSSLEYFIPKNSRQAGKSLIPGGGLLVAFENAWESTGQPSPPK